MSDLTVPIRDASLAILDRRMRDDGAAGLTPYVADPDRAALIAAFAPLASDAKLASILAKLSADPASQTTLSAVLAKLTSDPATATGVAAVATALAGTLKVALGAVLPEAWFDPTTSFDVRAYSDVEVQLLGTIAAAYQPQRSLTGANGSWVNVAAQDDAGTSYATITAAGIYSLPGNGYLRFTNAGAGATITRRAAA